MARDKVYQLGQLIHKDHNGVEAAGGLWEGAYKVHGNCLPWARRDAYNKIVLTLNTENAIIKGIIGRWTSLEAAFIDRSEA